MKRKSNEKLVVSHFRMPFFWVLLAKKVKMATKSKFSSLSYAFSPLKRAKMGTKSKFSPLSYALPF